MLYLDSSYIDPLQLTHFHPKLSFFLCSSSACCVVQIFPSSRETLASTAGSATKNKAHKTRAEYPGPPAWGYLSLYPQLGMHFIVEDKSWMGGQSAGPWPTCLYRIIHEAAIPEEHACGKLKVILRLILPHPVVSLVLIIKSLDIRYLLMAFGQLHLSML